MSKAVAVCQKCGSGMARRDGSTHRCKLSELTPRQRAKVIAERHLVKTARRLRAALVVLELRRAECRDAERDAYDCNLDIGRVYEAHGIDSRGF